MDIGKPERTIIVEPAEDPFEVPVPEETELPEPAETPVEEPVPVP